MKKPQKAGTVRLSAEPHMAAPQAEPPQREFLSIPAAADLVFVSQATIRRMLTKGQLTRYKFCSRTLISSAQLLAQIKF